LRPPERRWTPAGSVADGLRAAAAVARSVGPAARLLHDLERPVGEVLQP